MALHGLMEAIITPCRNRIYAIISPQLRVMIYKDGQLRMIIVADDLTVGCIDLFDFDPRNRRAALGMYIAPEYRGKWIGYQALEQLETIAFDHLNLRVLYAVIATNNIPCSSLYRRAGYQPSSVLPSWTLESDAVMWIKTK